MMNNPNYITFTDEDLSYLTAEEREIERIYRGYSANNMMVQLLSNARGYYKLAVRKMWGQK